IGDSLDWGQDLARLSSWVSRHSAEGPTQLCVVGSGDTEPYGLGPPLALPSQPTESGPKAEYLAVSEGILFGDRITSDAHIEGARPVLAPGLLLKLRRLPSIERVGRTIRIYRMIDVIPASTDIARNPSFPSR
ncbi:ArnT family glycosyltransferase, partial [Singulisphaera rosea]